LSRPNFVLSPSAQRDFRELRRYFRLEGGLRASRRITLEMTAAFELLAKNPRLGHIREDLAGGRSLLFWPVRDYLVVYRPGIVPLAIAMIVRGNRDVAFLLASRLQ
jgi:plasmid stabilization system protein ParE